MLMELHDKAVEENKDDDFDPVIQAAGDVITTVDFPAMSDNRIHDVLDYLQDHLEEKLSSAPSP